MYDTLMASEVKSLRDMKPGDLIFYQGDYTRPHAREQKHRMVHVEIYLGGASGRATVGSRWRSGVVSIFPSMRFHSTGWNHLSIRLCRIEPWLAGQCVPAHSALWETMSVSRLKDKRSVFYQGAGTASADAQEQDEGESDDDEASQDDVDE